MLKFATAAASAVLLLTMTTIAYAHGVDECVNEKTFECLDDDDFWGCYDFIVEDCQNHGLPHAPANLNKFKANPSLNLGLTTRN
jgi:hypothetical protein